MNIWILKEQASADIVRAQLKDLSYKIPTTVQLVFFSHKIEQDLKLRGAKPPIVNQQCIVYKFECDAGYVGFTRRVEEHQSSSSIGEHFLNKHSLAPKDLAKNFRFWWVARTNLTASSMNCFLI